MNNSIRAKVAFKYLACASLIIGVAACNKVGFSYDNLTENSATDYLITDTLTMSMSTIYLDSIPTSNLGVALCGTNSDPVFGKISASSYWQVKAFSGTTVPDLAVYDSMVLMVHPKTYYYGDTLLPQHLEVYRVTQDIKKPLSNAYLYSYYTFSTASTPLGSRQMTIRPHLDSVYRIRLDDALGAELYALCKKNSATVTDQTQFSQYLKGLLLKPGSNSQMITPFRADDSLNIRLFYHTTSTELVQTYIDFPLYNAALQFNHIDVDRVAGSPLASLSSTNKSLLSTNAGNRLFVQPLTNAIARIDFPYLRTFNQLSKFSKIMRATLTVRPEQATYQYPYTLPPQLSLCEVNSINAITDTLASPSTGAIQHGNLVTDLVYNLSTTYTYDITNYCIAELSSTDITTRGLALIQPRSTGLSNFDRVILGDNKSKNNRITVQIYYLLYK
jgi:hypothetical protein